MNTIFLNKGRHAICLLFGLLLFTACKERLDDQGSGASDTTTFNVNGVNYSAQCTEAFSFSKSIHIYYDTNSALNAKHISIVLGGSPVGSSLKGIRVGDFNIGAGNSLSYEVGLGGSLTVDYADTGIIHITSITGNKIRGSFDCLLSKSGAKLVGTLHDIELE